MAEVLRSGWLKKQPGTGKSIFKSGYQRRFVRMTATEIHYYATLTGDANSMTGTGKAKGSIAISNTTTASVQEGKHPYMFSVQEAPGTRLYSFSAETEEIRGGWLEAIAAAAKACGTPVVTVSEDTAVEAAAEAPPKATKKASPKATKKASPKAEKKASPKAEKKASPKATKKASPKAEKKASPKATKKASPKAEKKSSPKVEKKADKQEEAKEEPAPPKEAPVPEPSTGHTVVSSTEDWTKYRAEVAKEPLVPETGSKRVPGVVQTVRVFISSTFVDEHSERDELVRRVFAELNTALRDRWLQIVPVDLRWGVSHAETSVIQQTCLNEIDNCRANPNEAPWFIGLRGERYGWVQEKYDKPNDYYEPGVFGWLDPLKTRCPISITSLEVYHAVIGCRRSEAEAKKGPHAFIFFRDNAFKQKVPKGMQWIFDFEYLSEDAEVDAAVQYQYTKTDRYQRYKDDLADLNHQLRNSPDVCVPIDYYPTFGEEGDGSKVEKTGQLPTGKMFGVGYVGGMTPMGQACYDALYAQLDKEYPKLPPGSALEVERVQHQAFVRSQSRGFVGRKSLIAEMQAYVDSDTDTPLVVHGRPGSGKSTLVAAFCSQYDEEVSSGGSKGLFVITHIVGATGGSQNLRGTLRRFCEELREMTGDKRDIPNRMDEIRAHWTELLELASKDKKRKTVIIIDGVNQMRASDEAHKLRWVPFPLPKNVRVLISTLPEENGCLEALRGRTPSPQEMEVPMLAGDERIELVVESLAKYHKKLTVNDDDKFLGNQMELLMSKEESGSPLFLIAAVEELRNFAVYEKMTPFLRDDLPGTVLELFKHILDRLETDHGLELVSTALSLISVSRSGLSEVEIIEMLNAVEWKEEQFSNFSRLYAGLKIFISAGGTGLMKFFHQQLLRVVTSRYLPTPDDVKATHRTVATYFLEKIDPAGDRTWSGDYARGFSEMCYHYTKAEEWDTLYGIMSDLEFIRARCKIGSGYTLIDDYRTAMSEDTSSQLPAGFQEFAKFYTANVHVIVPHPDQAVTRAATYPTESVVAKAVWQTQFKVPFLQWVNKPQGGVGHVLANIRVHKETEYVRTAAAFSPHSDMILACAERGWKAHASMYSATTGEQKYVAVNTDHVGAIDFSCDGKMIAVGCKVTENRNKSFVARLCDAESGDEIFDFEGIEKEFSSISFDPSGQLLVACDENHNVVVWDINARTVVTKGKVGSATVAKFGASRDEIIVKDDDNKLERYAYAGGFKKTGDVLAGKLRFFKGSFSVSEDRKILATTGLTQRNGLAVVRLEDAETVILEDEYSPFVIGCHCAFPKAANMLAVATISNDAGISELHLYDLEKLEKIASIKTETSTIGSVTFTADGKRVAISGGDANVRIYDVQAVIDMASKGSESDHKEQAHSSQINSLAYTADGGTIVTSAEDTAVTGGSSGRALMWDAVTGVDVDVHMMNVREAAMRALSTHEGETLMVKLDGTGYEHSPWEMKVLSYPDCQQKALLKLNPTGQMLTPIDPVRFSRDGKLIYFNTGEWFKAGMEIHTWDIAQEKEVAKFFNSGGQQEGKVNSMEVSFDGQRIITATEGGRVVAMAHDTGAALWTSSEKKSDKLYTLKGMALFPDDKRVAVCGTGYNRSEGAVYVYDITGGDTAVQTVTDESKGMHACAVTHDGSHLITASDNTVCVWSCADFTEVARFITESNPEFLATPCTRTPQGTIHFAAGYHNGAMQVMRLIESKEHYAPDEELKELRAEVVAKILAKPELSEKGNIAGGGPPQNTIEYNHVPDMEGGKTAPNFTIDGKSLVPTSDKIFYKTKWTTNDGFMSANPILKAEWPMALGTPTSFSTSLCPIGPDGEADMAKQFAHAMGAVFEPGGKKEVSFAAGQILDVSGGMTKLDALPKGSYMFMITAMGSGGMDFVHCVATVE